MLLLAVTNHSEAAENLIQFGSNKESDGLERYIEFFTVYSKYIAMPII